MKQVLSVEDASTESGLSKETIRRAIKRRQLPIVRIGRRVLIQRPDFAAWLRGDAPGPIGRPMTDGEVADKLAALAGGTLGEESAHPASDTARVASALEAIVAELTGIRSLLAERDR